MISRDARGDKLIISFINTRRLNLLKIHTAEDSLRKEIGNGIKHLYLNMKGVLFIDSYSYSRLIAITNTANLFGTEFKLFNVSEELEEIFGLLNKNNQIKFSNPKEVKVLNSLLVKATFTPEF